MPFFKNKPKPLLDQDGEQRVVAAIRRAEADTSGEIRVFMEPHCSYVDAADRAREVFVTLKMHETVERNGVLIYLATKDRQFAILGDDAIFSKAGGPVFWEAASLQMRALLRQGALADAILAGIQELGMALAQHFPPRPGDNKNELPDEIVFG